MLSRELIGLALLIGIYGSVRLASWTEPLDVANPDTLIVKFEKTAFESEYGGHPGSIYRWEGPVTLYVDGPRSRRHGTYLAQVADHLTRLTGRQVAPLTEVASKEVTPNFLVVLDAGEILGSRLRSLPAAREFIDASKPNGYAIVGGDGSQIFAVVAAVRDDRPDPEVRATLLEEISQGFGLMNDTEVVQPSIWSVNGPNLDRLPLNDQIILRTLYDPALFPGMPKDEAMGVIRVLIPRLVETVKREGETALYQR